MFGREHIRDLVCATWMFRLCIVAVVFISYVLASLLAVNFPSQPRIKFQLPLDLLEESHSLHTNKHLICISCSHADLTVVKTPVVTLTLSASHSDASKSRSVNYVVK